MFDSVVSWAVVFIIGVMGFIAFLRVCVAAHRPARKDYGTVESMKINLDWGKKN